MRDSFELCRASADERRRRLPGDELLPHTKRVGAGRAGWYAYDHIDNGGAPSANRIIPELQHVTVGEVIPALPGAQDAFIVSEVVSERALVFVVPLQLAAADSATASGSSVPAALRASVALVLERMDQGRTRLIARGRISEDWLAPQGAQTITPGKPSLIERIYGLLAKMPWSLLLPVAGFGHYLMASRMLRGIKRRAERRWAQEQKLEPAAQFPRRS
jgi:hypothetical protein